MLSLDEELGQLRRVAARLSRTWEEEKIQEAILGISLYCRQMKETHAQEVAQLRDEIRILHGMIAQQKPREDSNSWRAQLQRRAEVETRIREALDQSGTCTAVLVPIPSPLVAQNASPEMHRFLAELQPTEGDTLVAVWTNRLAIVVHTNPKKGLPQGLSQSFDKRALPENFRLGEVSYVIRSRAWEVVASPGEPSEEYLRRIDERGKIANAS